MLRLHAGQPLPKVLSAGKRRETPVRALVAFDSFGIQIDSEQLAP